MSEYEGIDKALQDIREEFVRLIEKSDGKSFRAVIEADAPGAWFTVEMTSCRTPLYAMPGGKK